MVVARLEDKSIVHSMPVTMHGRHERSIIVTSLPDLSKFGRPRENVVGPETSCSLEPRPISTSSGNLNTRIALPNISCGSLFFQY
jgi:hypothetical protein